MIDEGVGGDRIAEAESAVDAAPDLVGGACVVLRVDDPWAKAAASRRLAARWFASDGAMAIGSGVGASAPPATPGRPDAPTLLDPRDMPKRRPGTEKGRAALLHAIAHIELNAIDLHWDAVARFTEEPMPRGYFDDWALAADQEAKHFLLLSERLAAMNTKYGDLPAHAGLWRSAETTASDFMGRLAVVPMVLEARGLDVTPGMIDLFRGLGDAETTAALETIYAEEVAHVAYGSKWFHFLCGRRNLDPKSAFHDLVRRYFGAALKPPFNDEKRAEAGLPPDFYWPLAHA